MTEKERQLYKSGRKNPNGFKRTPLIFRIKYNKKILTYTILVVLFSIVINFLLLFNFASPSYLYSKLNVIKDIEKQDSDFAVYYLDVGQSDCTIITCDDKVMMIDTGTKYHYIDIPAPCGKGTCSCAASPPASPPAGRAPPDSRSTRSCTRQPRRRLR